MTVNLWRIASDEPTFTADSLSGKGAEISGGRWNRPGTPVLYTATNVSLAAMETLVHFNASLLPLNRILVRIEVSKEVWKKRTIADPATLPVGWDVVPPGMVTLDFGDQWLKSGSSALLQVPSAIVPEEFNVLINPRHPAMAKGAIKAFKERRWQYDSRLRT